MYELPAIGSLPQFLVGPFPELLEVPPGVYLLWPGDLHVVLGHHCELDLVDGVAVPHVYHLECPTDDIFALLGRQRGFPFVGYQGQTEMLGEAGHDVVFLDQGAEEIHTGEYTFVVLEPGDDGAIVVRVHLIPALVADVGQVVHELLDRVLVLVVVQGGLVDQVLDLAGDLLEVGVLARGHDDGVLVDLLEAGDVLVL